MAVRMKEPGRTYIEREATPGQQIAIITHDGWREIFLTLTPLPSEGFGALLDRMFETLRRYGASVLKQTVFGANAASREGHAEIHKRVATVDWPVTWVDGSDCAGREVAGVHVHAVAGVSVSTITSEGRSVGRWFEDNEARYAILGDLRPGEPFADKPEQAYDVFCQMSNILTQAGLTFGDVVRTWLFVDRILDWYAGLNAARNRFFHELAVYDGLVPASTGIGCGNPYGVAMVAEAFAVRPADGGPGAVSLASPLQCPAPAYGSAFSRAVEVSVGGCRRILVSGTASIEPGGKTVYLGNVPAQARTAMRVVEALLGARNVRMADVTRAVAYFRRAEDAHLFSRLWESAYGSDVPAVVVRADVCRDDLLFEIEVDAIA